MQGDLWSLWIKQKGKRKEHTESSKIFEALKSLYITGLSASWRNAKPLAAPNAIFILVDHGIVAEYPVCIMLEHQPRLKRKTQTNNTRDLISETSTATITERMLYLSIIQP